MEGKVTDLEFDNDIIVAYNISKYLSDTNRNQNRD